MSERELAALEAAAKAVGPQEWLHDERVRCAAIYWGIETVDCFDDVDRFVAFRDGPHDDESRAAWDHIAAANPAAVLRLAAAYREALALLGDSETALDHYTSAQVVAGAKTRWICTPDCPACAWELRRAALLAGGGGEVQAP
jgi:hypothetical protein